MKKVIVLTLFLVVGFSSCQSTKKESELLHVAKRYYDVLNNSKEIAIAELLNDSLLTKATDYDYEQTFSLKEYNDWLKWDAVFDPKYEILKIEQDRKTVRARVSKQDRRILFLHEEPIVTDEIIRFHKGKIISIERANVNFNDSVFAKNREEFLDWINKIHPELSGFIHDQTEAGALQYLEAIERYKAKHQKLDQGDG